MEKTHPFLAEPNSPMRMEEYQFNDMLIKFLCAIENCDFSPFLEHAYARKKKQRESNDVPLAHKKNTEWTVAQYFYEE